MCSQSKKALVHKNRFIIPIFWVAFIGLYIFALYQSRATLEVLSLKNVWTLIGACLLIFPQFLAAGVSLSQAFRPHKRVSILEGVKAALVGTVGNYLPMSGGIFARGVYLKKTLEIGYSHYAGILVCLYLLNASVSGVFGVVTALLSHADLRIVLIFALLSLSTFLLYLPIQVTKIPYVGRFMVEANEARQNFTRVLIPCSLAIALFMVLQGLGLKVCYLTLGVEISLTSVLLINSVSILVRIFAFAPAGIGVKEVLTAAMAISVGIDAETTVLAVGLERLATIMASMILWPVLFGFRKAQSC